MGANMRLKKSKKNKTELIRFRCTAEDYNRIQTLANLYTEGNVSEFLTYSALNFFPNKDDFEDNKKGRK